MHVLPIRPGLASIRGLPRAIAHRWPALAVASVAAAVPLVVLAADFNGQTTFNGGRAFAIEAISEGNAAIVGISNQLAGINSPGVIGSGNPGVLGDGINDFVGVEGESFNKIGVQGTSHQGTGVQGHSDNGLGVDASGLVGVSAQGNGIPGNPDPNAVQPGSFGVVAGHAETGVNGSGTKTGVRGFSTDGHGVEAQSTNGNALVAQANTKAGTFAAGVQAIGDEAVVARGTTIGIDANATGIAVAATSNNSVGGDFSGKEAPIRLGAAFTPGAPTSGVHHRGELYVDSNGLLFYCTADGTPGTWKKVVLQ